MPTLLTLVTALRELKVRPGDRPAAQPRVYVGILELTSVIEGWARRFLISGGCCISHSAKGVRRATRLRRLQLRFAENRERREDVAALRLPVDSHEVDHDEEKVRADGREKNPSDGIRLYLFAFPSLTGSARSVAVDRGAPGRDRR